MTRYLPSPILVFAALAGMSLPAASEEGFAGAWRASNGAGVTSTIELYVENDLLNGRIVRITGKDGRDVNPVCSGCEGSLAGRPIVGMTFITGLRRNGNMWIRGKVVDIRPGFLQGTVADCDVEWEGARIRFHGYFGVRSIGRSSYWDRVPTENKDNTTNQTGQ